MHIVGAVFVSILTSALTAGYAEACDNLNSVVRSVHYICYMHISMYMYNTLLVKFGGFRCMWLMTLMQSKALAASMWHIV